MAIHQTFGGQSNQHNDEVPMALGSCLYDVFQGLVLDATLAPYKSSERELAFGHLSFADETDLILYDRGYPAFWLFAAHIQNKQSFCMRVKSNFNKVTSDFVASGKKQDIVTLAATQKMQAACQEKGLPTQPITVRLIRIKTNKGEYILMTNLLNKRHYPIKAFKELYHLRWQVEEGYKKQKSWLEIENFTGKSVNAVKQDFYARIVNLTLAAIMAHIAQTYIKPKVYQRQHSYKINMAQVISGMKDTLIRCLFGYLDSLSQMQWLKSIAQSLSVIRPGRSFKRKRSSGETRKHHFSYKRSL